MPSSHKGSIPQNALKLKKSCQKKFLKLFYAVPGLAVKTNVFLYKKFQDVS
tara:strand:- start:1660 stop:1812 length:153 start_codon:yes stop_codon:yes gene_type:complete